MPAWKLALRGKEKLSMVLSQEALVAHLRRHSSAFSRGRSKFRGVSGHCNRWEARIGNYFGRKNVSFGVYEEESEAAKQYDRALIISKVGFDERDRS